MITTQERKIVREMVTIYATYAAIVGAIKMGVDWGSVPQWITAIVAGLALIAAVTSIMVQRTLARKRAALDLFIRTELDGNIVKQYNDFETSIAKMKRGLSSAEKIYNDEDEADYRNIRAYLNIHELIAVGIRTQVLDETVCYEYWSDELIDAYRDGKDLIEYLRTRDGGSAFSYVDLENLSLAWSKRTELDLLKLATGTTARRP